MWTNPVVIPDGNLSRAWGRAFLRVMDPGSASNGAPLVLSITEFDELGEPIEVPAIRNALNEAIDAVNAALARKERGRRVQSVTGTAQTIFPHMCWSPRSRRPAVELFEHYHKNVLPRLRSRCAPNRQGTYFARMTGGTGCDSSGIVKPVNQLGEIIRWWKEHASRPINSSMQVSIYDPAKDHTGAARKGFPCLQQVSFRRDGEVLSLSAYYPTEYIFERGYGNYLGLCRLLNFMATELELQMGAVCVFVLQPLLDTNKTGALATLVKSINPALGVQTGFGAATSEIASS